MAARRAGSSSSATIAAASASGSRGGTRTPGLAVDDDLERAALARRDHRTARRHRLEEHAAERLAVGGVDDDVHRVHAGGDVAARAGEDDVAGQIGRGDALLQALGVLRAEPVDAADDQTAQLGDAPARARDRLGHQQLALPLLHVADDADAAARPPGCRARAGRPRRRRSRSAPTSMPS